ncbi:MAG TPA: hypothetical protein VGH87_19130 [Polyangiaceae bacterium]
MMIMWGMGPHETADVEEHGSFFATLFHAAGVWAPLTLGLLAVALIVNIVQLLRIFNRRVNGEALGAQLKKLIAAGNVDRAVKLCRAAPTAVAAQVALIGLNARQRNENPHAPMIEARDRASQALRPGALAAIVVGAAALVESVLMVAEAVAKGFSGDEIGAILVLPAVIGLLVAINAMMWRGVRRDVDAIIHAVR